MRQSGIVVLMAITILLLPREEISGQLKGNNLIEYQYGRIPGDTSSFSSVYDRLVLDYDYKGFTAGVMLEQFFTPYKERNYFSLSQVRLGYESERLEIKAGHFYETIGRGILLRSYEINGAVLEDLSYRSRHYFHRDIFGVSTRYKGEKLDLNLIYGKALDNLFPPVLSDSIRRPEDFAVIYSEYNLKKHVLGTGVLILPSPGNSAFYGMITASGKIFPALDYYIEGAEEITDNSILNFSRDDAYALYGNLNLTLGQLGFVLELKSYSNFLLGSGINEPPALVREHTYKVLNRSTHVLQPLNERGMQIEAFYAFNNLSILTLNYTLAENIFARSFIFREYFAEYSFSFPGNIDVKLFADYAEDPFKLEMNRLSTGGSFFISPDGRNGITADFEYQQFNRENTKVQNHVAAIGYSRGSKFLINVTLEISSDPFLLQDKSVRTWVGSSVKYQINSSNTLLLFAGNRRGGPACNSGVCYEVLDFSGIELRFTTRF